jgi:hypothetical protein
VAFQDESREIASEYKGGAGRYAALEPDEMDVTKDEPAAGVPVSMPPAPTMAHQPLPPMQSGSPMGYAGAGMHDHGHEPRYHHPPDSIGSSSHSSRTLYPASSASYHGSEQTLAAPDTQVRDCLTSQEETLFMQVFVEEVGLWMDSMDPHKHVGRARSGAVPRG